MEGDPLDLAEKRTKTFFNRKKIFASTPTIKDKSRIEKEFDSSTMEEWCLTCLLCGGIKFNDTLGNYATEALEILNPDMEYLSKHQKSILIDVSEKPKVKKRRIISKGL